MLENSIQSRLDAWSVEDSRNRGSKRWARYPEGVLDLTVAEMDFPTADPIMESLRHSVERQAFGYPLPEEHTEFQGVSATWLQSQGLPVSSERVFMLAHVAQGIVLAIKHLTKAESAVAVVTPTYSSFFDAVWVAGREVVEVPMPRSESGEYSLDLAAIEQALREGAGSVLLCNPSNPTGKVYSHADLAQLSEIVARYGARVISDEVHSLIRYTKTPHIPFASVSAEAAYSAITVTSASKAWNIPGLRCAIIAFTNDSDIAAWKALPGGAKGGISPLGVYATIAALKSGHAWFAQTLMALERKRDFVMDGLNSLGYGELMHSPDATYLGWLDVRQFGFTDAPRDFMEQGRVSVTDGQAHGKAGSGFIRINFATPVSALEEFLDRTESILGRAGQAVGAKVRRFENEGAN